VHYSGVSCRDFDHPERLATLQLLIADQKIRRRNCADQTVFPDATFNVFNTGNRSVTAPALQQNVDG
jgi:hypothetical protein